MKDVVDEVYSVPYGVAAKASNRKSFCPRYSVVQIRASGLNSMKQNVFYVGLPINGLLLHRSKQKK